MNNLIDINDIAEYLGLKVCTIYKWVHTKQIPYYKVGRLVKFRKNEIDDWLEERRVRILDMDTILKTV